MVGDEEPSAKKPRGMGSGTPSAPVTPAELPSQASASTGASQPADGSAGEAASGSSPTPAAAEAAAVSEADIQEVLAQVDPGTDWESAAKRRGRPTKPSGGDQSVEPSLLNDRHAADTQTTSTEQVRSVKRVRLHVESKPRHNKKGQHVHRLRT
eukprot:5999295-Amphidinium_carterae.1